MTNRKSWLIYGAYGVTGQLLVKEAIRQGLRPILAGRSADKLAAMGKTFSLDTLSFDLADQTAVKQALSGVGLVLNLAGPFLYTGPLLVEACLQTGTHYLDISNEPEVFQKLLTYQAGATQHKVAIMPGVGFGTMATNFLAKLVAEQLPSATSLEIAVAAHNSYGSSATTSTVLEVLSGGGKIYQDGQLKVARLGKGAWKLNFPDGEKTIMPVPLGDLIADQRVTGIANVKVYTPFNGSGAARTMLPVIQRLLKIKAIRKFAENAAARKRTKVTDSSVTTPSTEQTVKHSYAWACVTDKNGQQKEAWLELGEGYNFTAMSSVKAVQQVLEGSLQGVLFPAEAFATSFLTELEGVKLLSDLDLASKPVASHVR